MAYLSLATGSKGVRAVIRSEQNVILNSQVFPYAVEHGPCLSVKQVRHAAELWARPVIATYNLLEGCT